MSAKPKPDKLTSLKKRLREVKRLAVYAGDARDWDLCNSTDKEIEELEAEIAAMSTEYIDDDKSVIEPQKSMAKALHGLEYQVNSPSMFQPVKRTLMTDEQYREYVRGLEAEVKALRRLDAPPTLARAVQVLNEHKHRQRTDWHIDEVLSYMVISHPSDQSIYTYGEFDTVAIAEKYLREGK